MIKECWDLLEDTKRCMIKGKIKGREVYYTGSYPMDILGILHWNDLISNKYFEYITMAAKSHIKHPTAYEKSMWKTAKGDAPLVENEESIFMFSCWIEDKFNAKEIAKIIKKYTLLDEYELKFNYSEGSTKKYNTTIREKKECLVK